MKHRFHLMCKSNGSGCYIPSLGSSACSREIMAIWTPSPPPVLPHLSLIPHLHNDFTSHACSSTSVCLLLRCHEQRLFPSEFWSWFWSTLEIKRAGGGIRGIRSVGPTPVHVTEALGGSAFRGFKVIPHMENIWTV